MKKPTNDEPAQAGLVISDITGEACSSQDIFEGQFVSHEALVQAIEGFTAMPGRATGDKFPRFAVELSPGSVRLTKKAPPRGERREGYKPKTNITEWSKKSRASMTSRLCSLDYRPLFIGTGRVPALITLTYPGDWMVVAPNGQAVKQHLARLRKRYEYDFGEPWYAVWKMEFQSRGAPHFHIFSAPPPGADFACWLSEAWADIVAHPDLDERAKHVRAGTGIDYSQGLRGTDPKRIAVYFSKHNSAGFGAKEYQNKPPHEWKDSGSVGRFWGYWGLQPLVVGVEVEDHDAVFIARILRRWSQANNPARTVLTPRGVRKTGEMKFRRVRRRVRRFQNGLGFASVNDGSAMGEALSRAIQTCRR